MVTCVCGAALLAACADTTAIRNFSELKPSGANIQEAAASYDRAITNASTYNVLHTLSRRTLRKLKAQRDVQVTLIVTNARVISQFMNELGVMAGLHTKVSRSANDALEKGMAALQKGGKLSAQEASTTAALADFVGDMIESGEQQYSLRKVIGEENRDFQSAVGLEVQILTNIQNTDETDRILLGQLKYITESLKKKIRECRRAARSRGTSSRFPGPGCAQAYAGFLTFPSWYAAQSAQLDMDDALAGRLRAAFTSIGKAYQQLYERRNALLTKATWAAIKVNVESARAAISAARKL